MSPTNFLTNHPTFRSELVETADGKLVSQAPRHMVWLYGVVAGAVTILFPWSFAEQLDLAGPLSSAFVCIALVAASLGGVWVMHKFNQPLIVDAKARNVADGTHVMLFDDIANVELEENRQRGSTWRVWLRLKDGSRVHVVSGNDEQLCAEHAASVARRLGCDVRLAGSSR